MVKNTPISVSYSDCLRGYRGRVVENVLTSENGKPVMYRKCTEAEANHDCKLDCRLNSGGCFVTRPIPDSDDTKIY